MKIRRLQRFYRFRYGSIKKDIALLLENMSLEDFFLSIKPQIRKPVGLLLYKNFLIYGNRINQLVKDYAQFRKYKVYPLYKKVDNIKTYFYQVNPILELLDKYPLTSPRWDIIDFVNKDLFIVLDLASSSDDFENSKVYKVLKRLYVKVKRKQTDNLPNNIILVTIYGNKTLYIPLIIEKDYSKILNTINFVKRIFNKLPKKNSSEEVVDEVIEEIEHEARKVEESENDIRPILMSVISSIPVKDADELKRTVVERITVNTPEHKESIDVQFRTISKDIVKAKPVQIKRTNLITKSIANVDILDNRMPVQVKDFQWEDFGKVDEFIKTINDYVSSTTDLKLVDYKIRHVSPSENEIQPSNVFYIDLKFVSENGKIYKGSIKLPVLDQDGFMLINGKKWYVINQLYLLPITFPKKGVGKFTSYTGTFNIQRLKKYTKIYFAGSELPITLLISYLYGFEETFKDINYKISDKPEKSIPFIKISESMYILFPDYNDYDEYTQDFIRSFLPIKNLSDLKFDDKPLTKSYFASLINYITENNFASEYIIDLAHVIVDRITKKILEERNEPTNLKDILYYMHRKVVEGVVTDRNDLRFLRARSYEQLYNIAFDQIRSEIKRYSNFKKFGQEVQLKIDPESIFTSIVTSSAVRLLEYSNPIEELSSLSKVTYTGYKGIPSDAVPEQIRGIHPTFYGNIDPIDTPEGATTGVTQTFSTDVTILTKYGAIVPKEITDKVRSGIISLSTATAPFINRTEPTRGIMLANQVRQAVSLKNSEPPAVLTGVEFIIPYMSSDVFVKRSPCNGKIIDVTDSNIKIECEKGNIVNIDLSPKYARSGQGFHGRVKFSSIVKKGQKVTIDEILTDTNFIKDGILSMGRNFLVAYMFYKGLNYEDGIVVSDSVSKDLVSVHTFELFGYIDPEEGKLLEFNVDINDEVEQGQLIMKFSNNNLYQLIELGILDEENAVVGNKYLVKAPYKGKVVDIKIYVNDDRAIAEELYPKIKKHIKKTNQAYLYKGRKFSGMFIYVYIESEIPTTIGAKLVNRHAAKGVVTKIIPAKDMPKLPDGRTVEVIINPISVSGRINMGQIFEMYVGEISYHLANIVLTKNKKQVVEVLKNTIAVLDQTEYSKQIIANIERSDEAFEDLRKYVKKYRFFPILIPPFKSPSESVIKQVLEYLRIPEEYELTLPTGEKVKAPCGYEYIYKLEHMAENKIHARSIGSYQRLTGQPTAGKKAGGGQRLGELDMWALAAYDANFIIEEFFSAGADDFKVKRNVYRQLITEGEASISEVMKGTQKTKEIMKALFRGIMIDMEES